LERLQQLQQLQRLQQLERLQRLDLYSKSYNEINIPEGAVIYCDPPYKGTSEYKEGSFNHTEFWDWCRKIAKTNKIYVSEYSAPPDFETILKFEQKSTLQGGYQTHNLQPWECLFIPIGQENFPNSHKKEFMIEEKEMNINA
jgi:site-specific DNA-adenine methylase